MKQKTHYSLMVSCPSDVVTERALLQNCIDVINRDFDENVWIEMRYWATDTASDASISAQESINEQIVKDSDGLIAIFNSRLGTPVHNYKCGTEEEIDLMIKAGKHVSLLFNSKPQIDLNKPDCIKQITELVEFKKEKSQNSYYKEFDDEESFKHLVNIELKLWVRKLLRPQDTPENKNLMPLPNTVYPSEADENNLKLVESQPNQIDSMGSIDIVDYVTDSLKRITTNFQSFLPDAEQLNVKADEFASKITFLQKQPNSTKNTIFACKQFANQLLEFSDKTKNMNESLFRDWRAVYLSLKKLTECPIKDVDKAIVIDSLSSLGDKFDQYGNVLTDQISKLDNFPNVQKDLSSAMKQFNKTNQIYSQTLYGARDNCEELIRAFS